jgi:actin-like ATPase involved in cell morphogenesis
MAGKHVLGIDLGTYNSAAAVLTPEEKVVPISASPTRRFWGKSQERMKPFPSVVVYDRQGAVKAVGYRAKELAEKEPEHAVWGVKRLLAKTYKEALEHGELDRTLLPVEPDPSNGRCIFEFEGRDIRPQDVCADLLRHIRDEAEKQIGEILRDVVISVPAYFDALAVTATIEGAKLAGFDRVDTIPEPVAAALAYDLHITPRPVNILVFDIGAGTLDVTAAEVWRTSPGAAGLTCRCKKNTGDTHLGGLDMDDRLVQFLVAQMGLDSISNDGRFELRRAAEAAKIRLSTETETDVVLELAGQKKTYRLIRMELEEALRSEPKDLMGACVEQVRLALKGADWTPQEVDRLLLVGGPTAMPCFRHMLEQVFRSNPDVLGQLMDVSNNSHPRKTIDPMLAVAVGASRYRSSKVTKIHPYGYGFVNVRAEQGDESSVLKIWREPRILVPPDSEFPSDAFVVMPDSPFCRGDKVFSIEVIQKVPEGETTTAGSASKAYRFLGEFQLAFTAGFFFKVQVSMRLNENGELETTIRNLLGPERATYVGVGSLHRYPIELPTFQTTAHLSTGKWSFVSGQAEAIRKWGEGFSRFLQAKLSSGKAADTHIMNEFEELQSALSRWGVHLEQDINKVFTQGKVLLLRAQEVKVITEGERYRWEQELDAGRENCFQYEQTG